jgi:hypothetical protein
MIVDRVRIGPVAVELVSAGGDAAVETFVRICVDGGESTNAVGISHDQWREFVRSVGLEGGSR